MTHKAIATVLAIAVSYAVHAESPATANPASANAAVPVATQDAGKLPQNHGKRLDKVAQELGLSAEQKAKMAAIIEEKHQKIKALHEESRAKLKTVLTPEQFVKLDAMHPYRRHGKVE